MDGARRWRRLTTAALSAGVVLGLSTAPAGASTARLVDVPAPPCKLEPCTGPATDTALLVEGGREVNRMTLARVESGAIRIRDRAARIRPGRGCTRVDAHRVDCAAPTAVVLHTPVYVLTGGGADRVTTGLADIPLTIDGGPGNDVLQGGPRDDLLFAGAGADRLRGGGGRDRLHDASLRDPRPPRVDSAPVFPPAIVTPGRGRDSFDGGGGRDTLTYEGRTGRLTIDLASRRPVSGARGERDSIRRVENATGGSGNDRLRGGGGANDLAGGSGADRLAGRAGADSLSGGPGSDLISGGAGEDRIDPVLDFPRIPEPDRISCGSGRDLVGGAYPGDFVRDDCEGVGLATDTAARLNAFGLRSHLPLRRGRPPRVLSGRLGCLATAEVCRVVLELRVRGPLGRRGTAPARGTLLGSQFVEINGPPPFPPTSPPESAFDLRLSADGLRILRRHRALRVRVIFKSQFSGPVPPGYLTLVRAP